jgi:DNA repair exonuclease SbcCD ATPase subunit
MTASVEQIRERQRGPAQSHQQFAMTSMNNLALLLDDVLQNMQMTMSESMGKGKKGNEQNMPLPGLGEMQQQLGEQIQKLQQEGKSGRELSEELARLAAEQEMIRQQLEELQKKLNGQMGGEGISDDLSKAIKMMEDNEVDLVNKRMTKQLMDRQKEITTRLLEAENALKEQQEDPEREGETAQQRERIFPPKFEEYLNQRKKEIELLRSIPIELKPFYKKEVNDYFRRLSEKN